MYFLVGGLCIIIFLFFLWITAFLFCVARAMKWEGNTEKYNKWFARVEFLMGTQRGRVGNRA